MPRDFGLGHNWCVSLEMQDLLVHELADSSYPWRDYGRGVDVGRCRELYIAITFRFFLSDALSAHCTFI
jgi:hypothetical protein